MNRLHTLTGLVLVCIAASSLAWSAESTLHPIRYSVVEIPAPEDPACVPGYHSVVFARRMNENAVAIGNDTCYVATADPAAPFLPRGERAFRWSRSTGATRLPALEEGTLTFGRGINRTGTAVGWELAELGLRAPKWPMAGGVSDAVEPSSCEGFGDIRITRAEGITDRGAIAANSLKVGEDGECRSRFLLKLASGEEFVGPPGTLTAVNNHNVLVGSGAAGTLSGAIKWSPAGGTVLLSPASVAPRRRPMAWNINDRNEVVGSVDVVDDALCLVGIEPKHWAPDGTERTLPSLPGANHTNAYGLNRYGEYVGTAQVDRLPCAAYDARKSRAVHWCADGVADLNEHIPPALAREIQLVNASAINDHGQILVRGIRLAEAKSACPIINFDLETGEPFYDTTPMCQNEYAFLLTPVVDH